jgi:hypothetical protein
VLREQQKKLQEDLPKLIPVLLPLTDSSENSFAGANEEPPIDPTVFQPQQKKEREKRWRF